ncbi:MAG: hypothetical protein M4579_003860 [Chaenotheca gracillima]|nr:MAG: hypothetical protein M4579_003860 [Chaenotheca gracillima]
MSSEGKSKNWTEKEKLELCLAILAQNRAAVVRWNEVELPPGRTLGAAQFAWHQIKKDAGKTKPHTIGGSPGTPKKSPAKTRAMGNGLTKQKRKRGEGVEDCDGEDQPVKMEAKDQDKIFKDTKHSFKDEDHESKRVKLADADDNSDVDSAEDYVPIAQLKREKLA